MLVLLLALVLAAPAAADDDARVKGTCGRGAKSELRVRAKDGSLRVEFRVDSRRSRERWRVFIVHERRVVWRGSVRTRSGGSLRIRRSLPDYDGADEVSVRATGPGGNTCQATATLTDV
ncbi:MAG TPA: hypothetical protein VFZ00_08675 [Solirubrobacter sp.]|nr:hypothetical protein [Solirubrobacter sp.]